MRLRLAITLALLGASTLAGAQQRDWSKVEIESTPLRMGTHLLEGVGGNMVASVGDDGTFLVDDQYAPLNDKIRAALKAIDDRPVRFVINTHWHGDHTGGNEAFGATGAVIVAHDNVRKRMSTQQFTADMKPRGEPSPEGALPVVTFTEGVTLHLNGDTVRVVHVADAHTDGDALVKFERANVLHMGDTFFHGSYPFIDSASGGDVDGVLVAVHRGLELADADTIVVPGHGERTDRAGLAAYGALLRGYRDRIAAMKAEGQSLEEVIAAKPTAATDEAMGQGFIKPEQLVRSIYETL
ncbi:MBL fold metallo-hydrolase [Lysobacter sp. A3-1-A15]|uniref:MBL fold metallo-hydrolase n=1 Tax=Novilysobacter viscosus TaxID=3098602 RepID=UPI002ED912A9